MKEKRVLVALSGGVDSSVAAALLVERGFDVVGITLKLYDYARLRFRSPEGTCCSLDLIEDARAACARLGIPHYVIDLTERFEKLVIDDFVDSYALGRTPNPCINCNRYIKWGEMLKVADKLECRFVATGHYARICRRSGEVMLLKGLDAAKDQSYALWGVTIDGLRRTVLPLGELTKSEVRQLARKYGLRNAERPESQELCFVPTGRYAELVCRRRGNDDPSLRPGVIRYQNGEEIGIHSGYANYTIGQRRGLGISWSEPLYVKKIDPRDASITVAPAAAISARRFSVVDVNWLGAYGKVARTVMVKIRYRHEARPARLVAQENKAIVLFDQPERAVTPGQSAVFYAGDRVLGGGIIDEVLDS